MFCQYFQDPPDYSFVLLFHLHKDQNVIQVHHYDPLGYKSSEDVVHHSLESDRTIGHSKEHYEGFEEATISIEGCFPFISRLDVHIVETLLNVKFCEVLGSAELDNEFGDEWEGVSVLHGYGIQYMVVLDQLE